MEKELNKLISKFPQTDYFIKIFKENDYKTLTIDFTKKIINILKLVFDKNDKNYENRLFEADIIYNISWENINKGMYDEVPSIWRKVFGLSCLMLVYLNIKLNKIDLSILKNCLYLCDLSLMMGGELIHDDETLASSLASDIHKIIINENPLKSINDSFLKNRIIYFNPIENIPKNLIEKIKPLARINCPSFEQFLTLMVNDIPLILTNVIDHWPALIKKKWNVNYIKSVCGHRAVPIEIGPHYTHEHWTQKIMTVGNFIDEFFYDNCPEDKVGYLAQHYLFSQITELYDDIDIPDYCYTDVNGEYTTVDINGWFGPSGTVSPLHQDPKHNLLCQVFGNKYVKLFPSSQTPYLYPNTATMFTNTSKVDVCNPDLNQFPMFIDAEGFDGILNEGDVLFIPPKCWHYVTSLTASFSVNFWWAKNDKSNI